MKINEDFWMVYWEQRREWEWGYFCRCLAPIKKDGLGMDVACDSCGMPGGEFLSKCYETTVPRGCLFVTAGEKL